VAVEVTLGTGMSCISSLSRGEDNGSDNEDNLDDGQQGRAPPRLSVPCEDRAIQTDRRPDFRCWPISEASNEITAFLAR
jgi:hypothetical protein